LDVLVLPASPCINDCNGKYGSVEGNRWATAGAPVYAAPASGWESGMGGGVAVADPPADAAGLEASKATATTPTNHRLITVAPPPDSSRAQNRQAQTLSF
jgi:hypothetical protein